MPEYLSPGVYIGESDPGSRSIEGVSTSTGGFLGETERGPVQPQLVTSWQDYWKRYGGYFDIDGNQYLPYAVEGFFINGGQRCYIGRITRKGASKAGISLGGALTVETLGPVDSGNRVAVVVKKGSSSEEDPRTSFLLQVIYWNGPIDDSDVPGDEAGLRALLSRKQPQHVEMFDNLSADPGSPNFYGTQVRSYVIRAFRSAKDTGGGLPPDTPCVFLTGGSTGAEHTPPDLTRWMNPGVNEPGGRGGLEAFREIHEISIVHAPGVTDTALVTKIVEHCEITKNRFAIIDSRKGRKG
ncbi:MAG: hypothetical protein LUO96_03690, partial [Methanomicrobiales archaeon]|nr:hypothetical protein [Methanomicrobiales archaeon]